MILQLHKVSKQFDQGKNPAVASVSLYLKQGDLLGLLGPSGCGKTTLLRLIAGFEQPETGTIELNGQIVAGNGHWIPPEKRDIGMVFQDYALFPHLTVTKNVAFGLKYRDSANGIIRDRLSEGEIKKRTQEAIELVGLEGLENRYPHELSGGQQQRVALARALAPRPSLILLDEPLSNLDVQVRLRLREEVREILKKTGISAIFVTHDQEEALCISDYVGVMRQGKLEQFGTPESIYSQPVSRFVAEFVTQANFLPAKCLGKMWETEIGCFEVLSQADQGATFVNDQTGEGDIMIRQEDLDIKPSQDAKVIIHDRQFLGREYLYCLMTPSGRELYARTSTSKVLPIGSKVRLACDQQALQIFPKRNRENGPLAIGHR